MNDMIIQCVEGFSIYSFLDSLSNSETNRSLTNFRVFPLAPASVALELSSQSFCSRKDIEIEFVFRFFDVVFQHPLT